MFLTTPENCTLQTYRHWTILYRLSHHSLYSCNQQTASPFKVGNHSEIQREEPLPQRDKTNYRDHDALTDILVLQPDLIVVSTNRSSKRDICKLHAVAYQAAAVVNHQKRKGIGSACKHSRTWYPCPCRLLKVSIGESAHLLYAGMAVGFIGWNQSGGSVVWSSSRPGDNSTLPYLYDKVEETVSKRIHLKRLETVGAEEPEC
jgi:hypothetical protein